MKDITFFITVFASKEGKKGKKLSLQASCLFTLKYQITVQHLSNVHNGKMYFIWLAKKDNLMLLN